MKDLSALFTSVPTKKDGKSDLRRVKPAAKRLMKGC